MNANEAPEIKVTVWLADREACRMLEGRYAHRVGSRMSANVELCRVEGVYKVRWHWNKGQGQDWRGRFVDGLTEAAAVEIFDRKWAKLTAWLGKVEPIAAEEREAAEVREAAEFMARHANDWANLCDAE